RRPARPPPAANRAGVVRPVPRHFLGVLLTMLHLPRCYNVFSWRRYLELRPGGPMIAALTSGRPLLLVTGHFGNRELGGYTLGALGFPSSEIFRPLDNPFLDRFLRQFRQRTGQSLLARRGHFERMQEVLEHAGAIAPLGDQDAGSRGLFVDFFGRPASTHKAIALLSLQYGAPLVVLGIPRVANP